MRRVLPIAFLSVLCLLPTAAFGQSSSAVGFGGFSLNDFESQRPSLGGTLTFNLVPGVQVVGEAGRIGNVLPTLSDTVFSLARSDVRASAWYGEGGVRFLADRGAIAPYAEATAGVARLDVSSTRLGPIGSAATSIALGLVGRTSPIAGVGGGVLVRGGPITFDIGYRYKQLFANEVIESVLGLGQPLHTNQVRVGVGVRF
jgi:opacity protein-like surface antigen